MSEENKQEMEEQSEADDDAEEKSITEEDNEEGENTVEEKEEDTRTQEQKDADEKDLIAKIKKVDDWQTYLSDKDLYEDLFFEVESSLDFEDFMKVVRKLKKDKDYKDWAEENV